MRISRSPSDVGQSRSVSMHDEGYKPFRRQGSHEGSGSEGSGTRPQEFESRVFRRQLDKQVTFEDERQYSPPKGQHARDSQPYHRPNQRQNRRSWEYGDDKVLPPELKNNPLLRSGSFHDREQKHERYNNQHGGRGQQNHRDQHDRRGQQKHHGNQQNRNYNRQGSHDSGHGDYQRNGYDRREGYDRRDNYRDIREQYRKGDNEGKENFRNSQGQTNRQLQRSQSREERKGFVSNNF